MCGNGCPAKTSFQSREVRGRDDFWVAELSIGYDGGPENFGISILELRGDKIARESIRVTEGLRRRSGGLNGGLRPRRFGMRSDASHTAASSGVASDQAEEREGASA